MPFSQRLDILTCPSRPNDIFIVLRYLARFGRSTFSSSAASSSGIVLKCPNCIELGVSTAYGNGQLLPVVSTSKSSSFNSFQRRLPCPIDSYSASFITPNSRSNRLPHQGAGSDLTLYLISCFASRRAVSSCSELSLAILLPPQASSSCLKISFPDTTFSLQIFSVCVKTLQCFDLVIGSSYTAFVKLHAYNAT